MFFIWKSGECKQIFDPCLYEKKLIDEGWRLVWIEERRLTFQKGEEIIIIFLVERLHY